MTETALAITVNATEIAVETATTLVVGVSDAGSTILESERAIEIAMPEVIAIEVAPGGGGSEGSSGDPAGTAAALVAEHMAAADPHPQYQTQAKADTRYAPAVHAHTGTYDPAGTATSAVAAHAAATDPHPQYVLNGNLAELVRYIVAGALVAGENVTITPDHVGDSITISAEGGGEGPPSSGFPAGTRMLFCQATAPLGWTQVTEHNNKALRVVSGVGGGSGGSVAFTTAFSSSRAVSVATSVNNIVLGGGNTGSATATGSVSNTTAGGTVGGTTLTNATMPSHSHSGPANGWTSWSPGTNAWYATGGSVEYTAWMGNTGQGGAHAHAFTGASHGHTFTGNPHSHSIPDLSHGHSASSSGSVNLAVEYVDAIIASKD